MAIKKLRDTDYLYISSYIHAIELRLIGAAKLERMIAAPDPASALKVLEESGWKTARVQTPEQLEAVLSERRSDVFGELAGQVPNPALVDAFRVKYDYHNAKVLVKGAAAGIDGSRLLSGAGRIAPETLKAAFAENDLRNLPPTFSGAIVKAVEILAKTGDPQLADFELDRAYFEEFLALAVKSGSEFLQKYAQITIDAANLRSGVRAKRTGQELFAALADGGAVPVRELIRATESAELFLSQFKKSALSGVLEAAAGAFHGGTFTELEKRIDELLLGYLAESKKSPFGDMSVAGYIGAVENEIAAVRTVMTGKYAGLDADTVRSRLRLHQM
ncbi:MAG: V-type ATPase subunit [Oscillospiraceae bacterium]|jgi:V/A-type H+-transporting ATPase subunit C|nr:V-type ATPase subunit [Oscillospiraceae bacterium]